MNFILSSHLDNNYGTLFLFLIFLPCSTMRCYSILLYSILFILLNLISSYLTFILFYILQLGIVRTLKSCPFALSLTDPNLNISPSWALAMIAHEVVGTCATVLTWCCVFILFFFHFYFWFDLWRQSKKLNFFNFSIMSLLQYSSYIHL